MEAPVTSPRSRTSDVFIWALKQVGLTLLLLLWVLVVGLAAEIVKRRFKWGAFFVALLVSGVGIGAIWVGVFAGDTALRGGRELTLWLGSFAAMGVGGALTSRLGRKFGYYEGYLMALVLLSLLFLHLATGLDRILGFGPNETETFFEYMQRPPPGELLLGEMWDRVFGLMALGMFVTCILGQSITFLFFGSEGRLDAGFRFEWRVARGHLSGRRGSVSATAVVALLGVALGVGTLVTVTSVMSGYERDVQDKILSTNAHLVVQKYGLDFTEYDEIRDKALAVPGVLAGTPFTFNEAMLSDGDLGLGVLLKGIVPQTAGDVTAIEDNLCRDIQTDPECTQRLGPNASEGQLARALDPINGQPTLILGAELFRKLGRRVGDQVSLTTPVGITGSQGNAPHRMSFRIGGAFRSGMHEFDSRLIYMALEPSQNLMGLGETVTGVEFRVENPEQVEQVAKRVMAAVGHRPCRSRDWRNLNSSIFIALKLQKIVMFLVLCSIIVVAAFNIASTLFMAVVEKSHEIGVLKSMGCRDSSIMKVFMMEGWMVGAAGTALGVVLGLVVCAILSELDLSIAADVYMVSSLEVRVNPPAVVGTVVAALAISHLATLYPSLKAARQNPVDAMRYE